MALLRIHWAKSTLAPWLLTQNVTFIEAASNRTKMGVCTPGNCCARRGQLFGRSERKLNWTNGVALHRFRDAKNSTCIHMQTPSNTHVYGALKYPEPRPSSGPPSSRSIPQSVACVHGIWIHGRDLMSFGRAIAFLTDVFMACASSYVWLT